jgi:hypothetical protein
VLPATNTKDEKKDEKSTQNAHIKSERLFPRSPVGLVSALSLRLRYKNMGQVISFCERSSFDLQHELWCVSEQGK